MHTHNAVPNITLLKCPDKIPGTSPKLLRSYGILAYGILVMEFQNATSLKEKIW